MQIGKIARATGTKVNTVRYYEEIGLLKPAPRSQSGRRIYADADVERLAFIRRARGLGFSVSEVRSLLEVSDGDPLVPFYFVFFLRRPFLLARASCFSRSATRVT